ncbi:hypothetical protein [Nakamurella sp.]|uniref:hypothetical protein n=1 Tax=Nakamurella sp. TaxID=1869182 RepID=UPI003B3A2B26
MTTWSTQDAGEADPADVAEQTTPVDADDLPAGDPAGEVNDIGEADPADVVEQAIEIGVDDGYDRG